MQLNQCDSDGYLHWSFAKSNMPFSKHVLFCIQGCCYHPTVSNLSFVHVTRFSINIEFTVQHPVLYFVNGNTDSHKTKQLYIAYIHYSCHCFGTQNITMLTYSHALIIGKLFAHHPPKVVLLHMRFS